MTSRPGHILFWAAIVACVAALLAGLKVLTTHESVAGAQSAGPPTLAGAPELQSGRKPVLILFAHPRCPCTMASLAELEEIEKSTAGRAEYHVFFVRPTGEPAGWERTAAWEAAAHIPHVDVRTDADCRLARQMGAATSGHTLCYDAAGTLRYHGGITLGRGQIGRNPGEEAALAVLKGQQPDISSSGVFGCGLFSN